MLIDLRPYADYVHGHIPCALSLPFTINPKRERPLLSDFAHPGWLPCQSAVISFFDKNPPEQSGVEAYCHSGTWRSQVFAGFAGRLGIRVRPRAGGYRDYLKQRDAVFHRSYRLIVLAGETGTGKSDLLAALAEAGEQVVDLEGLAGHAGSVFGGHGREPLQPTVEQFQNNLSRLLATADPGRVVWTEDKNQFLGRVAIPPAFWQQMRAAPLIRLHAPREERVQYLLKRYGGLDRELLVSGILMLRERLGEVSTMPRWRPLPTAGWMLACALSCHTMTAPTHTNLTAGTYG
jgi:tRNA 2-selenouridine synthase